MHSLLVAVGVLLVIIIVVHILFKIVKFTVVVFLLGLTLIATIYVFQQYLGIDLAAIIASHI